MPDRVTGNTPYAEILSGNNKCARLLKGDSGSQREEVNRKGDKRGDTG